MGRARKTDPALAAELRSKTRSVSQIPSDALPGSIDAPAALDLTNTVVAKREEEGTRAALAQTRQAQSRIVRTRVARTGDVEMFVLRTKSLKWESLNPRLRLSLTRKPCRPHLHRPPLWITRAPAPARIHQQITEPPRPAAVAQSQPQKPHLIPPPHRQRGKPLVKRPHSRERIPPVRLPQTYSPKCIPVTISPPFHTTA